MGGARAGAGAAPTADEAQRLRLLAELCILDTDAETDFDALTRMARLATGWPMALISLIDDTRQWFKSHNGLEATETPREHAFCAHALHGDGLFEVHDASADVRFADNPLVTGEPHVVAYAGQPLRVQGVRLGTLCVIHTRPATLGADQREQLLALGAAASALLNERLLRARLQQANRRLQDFAAAAGEWLWETDARHRVRWLSSRNDDQISRSTWVRLGETVPDGALVDARGQSLQPPRSFHDLCAEGAAFRRVNVEWTSPRGRRWLSVSAQPFTEVSGEQGLRGQSVDVTDQVMAERARDADVLRVHLLAAQVPGALYQFRVDRQGRLTLPFTTAPLETLFELPLALVAADAQPLFDRVHPEDLPGLLRSIEASRAAMTPWQANFRVRLPKGGERHLAAHSTPQPESDGAVLWNGMLTDITAQVRDAQDRDHLQHERDRALRDAEARKIALSRMSHELRTPLNAILGFTQMMQAAQSAAPAVVQDRHSGPSTGATGADWLLQIHRAASHLLVLVDASLNRASVADRPVVVDLEAVDIAALARQVVEMMTAQAGGRDQSLRLEIDRRHTGGDAGTGPVQALADRRALRQVLINLVGNACKYTQAGGRIELRVSMHSECDVVLEVSDNGPGIAAEHEVRLFQPYERGAHAGSETAGTGLGLFICQQFVQAMQGRLSLRSEVGHGSVFRIRLPRAPVDEDADRSRTTASESLFGGLDDAGGSDSPRLPDAQVLYVEDDTVNGLLMSEFFALSMPDLHFTLKTTLADGLAAARQLQPQLLMLDMHLPDGTGLDLLKQLRADPRTAGLQVVAVSADALPEHAKHALAQGFDGYWTKPVDLGLLRRRLAVMLAGAPPVRPGRGRLSAD